MTLQVNADHRIPVVLRHVEAHAIAQDARVVDEHVELTVRFDGLSDQALRSRPRGDVVVVGRRDSAFRFDLVDDGLRRSPRVSGPVELSAEIVDDDLGSLGRHHQRVRTTETAARTGHDRYLAVENAHVLSPREIGMRPS